MDCPTSLHFTLLFTWKLWLLRNFASRASAEASNAKLLLYTFFGNHFRFSGYSLEIENCWKSWKGDFSASLVSTLTLTRLKSQSAISINSIITIAICMHSAPLRVVAVRFSICAVQTDFRSVGTDSLPRLNKLKHQFHMRYFFLLDTQKTYTILRVWYNVLRILLKSPMNLVKMKSTVYTFNIITEVMRSLRTLS